MLAAFSLSIFSSSREPRGQSDAGFSPELLMHLRKNMCASGSFGITQALQVTEEHKYLAGTGPCLLAASVWVAMGFGHDLLRPHKPGWGC